PICDLHKGTIGFRRRKTVLKSNSLGQTYETTLFASVRSRARCRLLCSSASLRLLLSWTVLPVSVRRPLLPLLSRRALLSAPEMGWSRLWPARLLSVLVNRLTVPKFRKTPIEVCLIAEVKEFARWLAAMEAMTGLLYVAVLIALGRPLFLS